MYRKAKYMKITVKKPKKEAEGGEMTLKEAQIRYNLLNILPEPKNCVKTDVIIYKHGAGRINFWHIPDKVSENGLNLYNYDIKSYYFTHNSAEIVVFDEEKVVRMVKL